MISFQVRLDEAAVGRSWLRRTCRFTSPRKLWAISWLASRARTTVANYIDRIVAGPVDNVLPFGPVPGHG